MLTSDKNIKKSSAEGFIGGVMILSLSTVICKVIGLFFKIPIINIVGIDGMAYFSSAYNIYMLLNSIAAAGLPVALSILVSRNRTIGNISNVKKIFKIALMLFLALGIGGSLILFFGAEAYSDIIGIEGSLLAVRAIAPTLLFICISGAIRGYFQGYEFMLPTAISQLIESAGKLILGVSFAMIAVDLGMDDEHTAAAAILGLSSGVLISAVYLIIHRRFFKKREVLAVPDGAADRSKRILSDLFVIALPITLASCVTSLTSLADTLLITNRLIFGGFSKDAAVTLYSSYTNLAIPLFNLPPALITAVSVSLVPALTASITRRNQSESDAIFSSSVRLCVGFSLPAAAGMAMYAAPILKMIYPAEPEACAFAAPLLSILSAAIVFACLTTVFNAVLQAYLKPALSIVSMAFGAVVKIIAEYFLVGSELGIYGAPISTVACTFTILLTDMVFVMIHTPHRIAFGELFKTLAATVISIGSSGLFYLLLQKTGLASYIVLLTVICIAVILYAVFALIFGVVRYGDIVRLPFGEKAGGILKKIKLIKD